ncbi:MAG: lysophospholipid acyltransferase family protein [Bacteroidetes bacterium]|nr:lipid A biosynthesis acyltransferase [Bacteroidota bacterium]MBV6461544.1 Lipid A biosynthesis lauroyltransferase [Flavobacteriales bacterium]WKZ76462.1 MAG: lysophospholipid acyltransferase family protein [Vicingaceae bacterium]MCL4815712.1 lysophospholipid acyltransferase family protein [Flavobacteriales bacterium]NOG94147.1 lysophospholipid acyltransferase family protein [Bacteroidota bacterium]
MHNKLDRIFFYILLPFIYAIGILPLPLLYLKSYFFSFVLQYIIGYRKKVVYTNLKNAFPEKNEKEIKRIARKYYLHLSDLIFETLKSFFISKKQLNAHCNYDKPFVEYMKPNKSLIVMLSHLGNWEWANLYMSIHSPYKVVVVYKKISNRFFDDFLIKKRSRFGSVLVEMNHIAKYMLTHKNEKIFYVFLCDQTPLPKNAHWELFFNQETPFLRGAAVLAQKMNFSLLYGSTEKNKRGHYSFYTKMMVDLPNSTDEKNILHTFIENLESDIRKQPEIWLWSHKRWKHKKSSL